MSVLVWIGVGLLGGVGAVGRLLLDGAVSRRAGGRFPVGTLAVNLCGAFVLGLLAGLAISGDALLLAGTATIGSFTTFSTWMLESHRLGEGGERTALVVNVVLSLAAGLGAAELGRLVGGG